ncbi:MAG: methionyl-tRNA formyltransferase [Candidatus Hydrogenedentota bacterium]
MLRIAVAGGARLGMSLIEPLAESPHELVAIIQDGRKVRGWRRRLFPLLSGLTNNRMSVAGYAHSEGIPLIWLDTMTSEELAPLAALEPDLILVGGFGIILKPRILELPRIGCVNCHSSLLPRHRGPNPFAWALLSGDDETGVSFHVMDPGIDTGDILDQTAFPIGSDDTTLSIYRRACDVSRQRVVPLMDRIEAQGLRGTPQDPARATYEKQPTEKDAWIDWRRPADSIERQIRALSPSPAARFLHAGRTIYAHRAACDPQETDARPGVVLECGAQTLVATGKGSLRIRMAFMKRPFPFIWPAPWHGPRPGDQLPVPEDAE